MTTAVCLAALALALALTIWWLYTDHRLQNSRREQQHFAEHVRAVHAARQNLEQ
jgi:hypothetical protein